jgi:hypothetical protein
MGRFHAGYGNPAYGTLGDQASLPDFRWDDPTTWNTLVFMADR